MRTLAVATPLVFAICLGVAWLASDGTVYAPGYSETKFKSIRIGMSQAEVIRILGEPLRIISLPGYIRWTCAPKGFKTPAPTEHGITFHPPVAYFTADPTGKVIDACGNYEEIHANELIGHQLDDVRERFGEPFEVRDIPNLELYLYTELDGNIKHNIRVVNFDDMGRVWSINTVDRSGY